MAWNQETYSVSLGKFLKEIKPGDEKKWLRKFDVMMESGEYEEAKALKDALIAKSEEIKKKLLNP